MIPLLQTQGVPDFNATVEILDKVAQTCWSNSITCKSIYFNRKKLPKKLKCDVVIQVPGDIVVTLGAIHQGHGWVYIKMLLYI